jgi:hypothetical protein
MKTFFVHDEQGILIGWIDAVDEASAQAIAEVHYGEAVNLSLHPEGDWYSTRNAMPTTPELAFAA